MPPPKGGKRRRQKEKIMKEVLHTEKQGYFGKVTMITTNPRRGYSLALKPGSC